MRELIERTRHPLDCSCVASYARQSSCRPRADESELPEMLANRGIRIELSCADSIGSSFPRQMHHLAESSPRRIATQRDGAAGESARGAVPGRRRRADCAGSLTLACSPRPATSPFPPRRSSNRTCDFPHPAFGEASCAGVQAEKALQLEDAVITVKVVVAEPRSRIRQAVPSPEEILRGGGHVDVHEAKVLQRRAVGTLVRAPAW
jgi:hypothetical protein